MLPADLESEKDADGKPKPRTFTAEDMRRIIDRTQYVLERGATIFFGPEPDTPADSIHVNWIAGDEGFLSDEIIKFSGLDVESQQKLSDLLKNGNGSESSIVSAESTASSQAS
jgi:hypothetical protein